MLLFLFYSSLNFYHSKLRGRFLKVSSFSPLAFLSNPICLTGFLDISVAFLYVMYGIVSVK